MKKKLIFFSLLISSLSNLIIFLIILFNFRDIQNNIISISVNNFKSLGSEIFKDTTESAKRKLEDLQFSFQESKVGSIKKDALSVGPFVSDNSFSDLRSFLNRTYTYDNSLTKVVFVDANKRLWQYTSDKFKNGLELGTSINKDGSGWVGQYQKKTIKLKDQLIPLLIEKSNLVRTFTIDKNGTPKSIEHINQTSKTVDNLIVISPVTMDGEFIGNLLYQFSMDQIQTLIQNEQAIAKKTEKSILKTEKYALAQINNISKKAFSNVRNIVILFLLLVLVITFGTFYYLGAWLTKPILKLTKHMKVVATGEYIECEVPKTNDEIEFLGEHFNIMIQALLKRDKEIFDYQNNLEDILNQRTKQLDMERSKNIQNSKLASLGEMAAGIAHEINNPLAIIALKARFGQKVMEKEGINSKKMKEVLEVVSSTVVRAAEIISGLKEFSRNETDSSKRTNYSICDIIDKTLILCKERLKQNDIKLELKYETDYEIYCNKVQISQVILNIINNARYAIMEDKDADRWLKINVLYTNGQVSLEFINSGKKISNEITEKILEPFFTTKPEGEGTGLGLSVSRSIVQAHNGEFFVDQEKKNTCFTIVLPCHMIKDLAS